MRVQTKEARISEPANPNQHAIHPVLASAFVALERAAIRWCVLRGEAELDGAGEDVDLLVAEADRARAATALEQLNYVRVAAWGRGSHQFFLTYDTEHDAWVKLDIVSTLSFGPQGVMETGTADACLDRRKSVGGIPLLSDEDRFWALLLHCILDRDGVPERHAAPLRSLAKSGTSGGPLATWFTANGPDGWNPARALAAACDSDWPSLVAVGRRVRSAPRWRSGPSLTLRGRRAAARHMTKLQKVLEPGLTLALLGPDGAGKSTLAAELARTFYFPARSIYMGLYGARSRTGVPPRGVIGHLGRMIGHLGRQWSGYLRAVYHRSRGRLVVYDRFGYDALLQQPRTRWIGARVRSWLLSHAVPSPDLVLVLDAPPELLQARKQEHDLATLESQRQAYLDLAARMGSVRVVRTDRSADAVRRDVTGLIWQQYVERRRGRNAKSA